MAEAPAEIAEGAPLSQLRRWVADLSLLAKFRLIIFALLILFVCAGLAFLMVQQRETVARRWTVHTYQALWTAERAETALLNMRLSLRDGLLGADASKIEAFQVESDRYDALFSELRELMRDNPVQEVRLERIENLKRDWDEGFVRPSVERLRSPDLLQQKRSADDLLALINNGSSALGSLQGELTQMRAVEHGLLATRIGVLDRAAALGRDVVLLALLLALISTLYALIAARRLLAEPLRRLIQLIPDISAGGHAAAIPYRWRRDEVGEFARSLSALAKLVEGRAGDDWVKTRLASLAGDLQLADTHEAFGDALLRSLCPPLDAGYGVAYRWDALAGELQACASYGVSAADLSSRKFKPGQGLVGQCVAEKRTLSLSPVPPTYLKVVSGLGSMMPDTLSFAPLFSRGEIVGVVELASLKPPSALRAELLAQARAPSALAWQTLARSLRTAELLDVTRSQSEELRSSEESLRIQQEELQSSNEALRSRSQLLEQQSGQLIASEEELRAQAEELRLANETLRERSTALRARQAELEAARGTLERHAEQLERASRYKSEFLANMSHELRTPLNSLLILSKGLADNEDGNLQPDQVESARIVHDAGRNLLQLINDILDLSKVEAGRMLVVSEDVGLRGFATLQERNFRHVARSHDLEFKVVIGDDAPQTVRTDGTRLGQIVVNLLANAFKFTEKGSVTLHIGRPDEESLRHAGLAGLVPGRAIGFKVSDTGIGIPPDRLDAIFQPFEQVDSGTARRFGGTGLGLSIARGMAGLLGGSLQAHSAIGVGSSFLLILPERLDVAGAAIDASAAVAAEVPTAAATSRPAEPLEPSYAQAPASDERAVLLIVEDDASFANILAGLAARKSIPTRVVSSGAEALKAAAEMPLLGVLLDIGLPDISGWQVLQQLKALPATQQVPVHIISASDDLDRGLALGAVGVLTKPVSRESVLAALDRVIAPGGDGAAAPRRVLLVDDDLGSRAAVRKLLEPETAQIEEAQNASEASTALRARRFDCLILDLGLPDVSGLDLLDELSAAGVSLPPVVVYSGRELSPDEMLRLRQYTESIVIKGSRAPERLLDEVSLFLHALTPPRSAGAAAPADVVRDVAGRHVLIVDDDMRNIFALSKALRTRKLEVTMAQDGYKALTQLDSNPGIDLVLMDIMMPGMDGYETIRRIRERDQWKQLPIIAVTAKAMTGDRERCLQAGANDYCAKPIDIDQLMSQIRVWI
ncbi:MAG: histidine kinase [Hydrocarboniphaga sp.]|uniref:response regulator n=1 Tax=Hydrocarboniphaga sp. TaxID=2033016 RepID=UPI0026252172|nr:response regulator [Hydrocarboniphaga sp.]MDB5969417.1 histidine kinase [Hydrocarboniphaga sp.]